MAVVTQPFDRSAVCEAPGDPDRQLGEFWEDDPWSIAFKHNLSAYERNRLFLNRKGEGFTDVSYVSDADVDGDSRSAVAIDFDRDGDQDIALRQVGDKPLILFRNDIRSDNWLKISLRGTTSNRLGIGARVTATVGGRIIVRELYPINTFNSQGESALHFGLGDAAQVDNLEVQWPGAARQIFNKIKANQHIMIVEDHDMTTTPQLGKHAALQVEEK